MMHLLNENYVKGINDFCSVVVVQTISKVATVGIP